MKLTCLPFATGTKAVKLVLGASVLSLCTMVNLAQAGIINTDNDTFIDQDTQLEWMDFGINNQYSYNEVSNMLGAGDLYEGWRLANEYELTNLFINAFYDGADTWTDHRSTPIPAVYQARAKHKNEDTGLYQPSAFEQVFDAMSFNASNDAGSAFYSFGLYQAYKGQLDILYMVDFKNNVDNDDNVTLYNGRDLDANETSLVYSTMLVRDFDLSGSEVPEPGSLALFALAITGLSFSSNRRRRLNKH